MGGLSSGPGPGLCLLTLVVLIVAQQAQSAPVQEDSLSPQSRAQGYYDGSSSELSTGCYYNFQHYGEGDRIITNEPCLNCTCHNRMLMCYLRVCPFTKAIGQNCTIEKKPGQCCPLIICPEVPVQLLTSSTTTEHSESLPHRNQIGYGQYGTAIGHLDDYGCKINGEFYTNGAQIPGNIDKPCEVCYCIRNRTACIMQECTLQVEGCIPVYEEGLCCPVRYQCDYEYNYNAITTEQPRPTPGLVLTTTTSGPFECQHDNKWYADGAMVETEDSCEHCYCMKGDIVCAVQECKPPFEKDGHNCTAMPPAPGKCCPDSYHCDGNEIVDDSEPTFRQDRMHKFGQNNANITMSITSSTSNGDKQHSWHYGTSSNENEMPNRFTDDNDKDGTTKLGKPTSDSDIMVTEGVPPTTGPLESGSLHIDGHAGGSEMRPLQTRPVEGQSSTGQGHGVSTDNMLTISQVIQSIVQNQTNLFNQNKFNYTGKPEKKPSQQDDKIIFPIDVNLEKKPGVEFQTDEDGNPIDAHSGATDFPNEYYGFTGSVPNIYAEHSGRPQKKPSIHKKPGAAGTQDSAGEPVTGENQDFGGHKRPGMAHNTSGGEHGMTQHAQKKPFIHQRPGVAGTLVLTDDEGNPLEIYEGATGEPEMVSGRPGSSGIYSAHDEQGRPQRPGMQEGATGLYGEAQEGFTGRPDSDGISSSFDEYGRPQKKPVIHEQPTHAGGGGENVMGSQDFIGKPGGIKQPEIFGEHGHIGRPHKKPTTHKKPGTTDDEMVTETYEGITGSSIFTGKPITDEHGRPLSRPGSEILTDEDGGFHGKPQKRPGIHKQPGQISEDGNEGYETVTETGQDLTSLHEIQTVYDENDVTGRPTIHQKPGLSESSVLTSAHGKPVTDSYGDDGEYIYYDKYGKPHKRPNVHKRPGVGSEEGEVHFEGTTEVPEGFTQTIDSQDELNIPFKKPQIHIKPSKTPQSELTDDYGNPVEDITAFPEGDEYEIFYDKYGRPHKRPATHKTPVGEAVTDKTGKPVDGVEGITETPDGHTRKPEDQNHFVYYDQYGRPHKRPVTHKKPASGEMTDEQSKPVDGIEGVTDFPEGFTGKPETDDQIYYDEYGRPHKRPVTHKKPVSAVMTDEKGKPVDGIEGVTDFPEGFTGKPETDDQIYYDEYGRPHKRPVTHKKPVSAVMTDEKGKPVDGIEGVTDFPEGYTGKPGTGDHHIFFDEYGRPHKRPVTHKKPVPGVMTDEQGTPVDGIESVTDFPESFTGKPGTHDQIFYDEYGRPHKRPITHKKPVSTLMTDEQGKPVDGIVTDDEGVTDFPEGFTGKPGTGDHQIFFDVHGRPHRRPVTHKKPVPGVMTDEQGTPVDGIENVTDFPESFTGKPGTHDQIFYDEYGRPHKRPVSHTKPDLDGEVLTDEHDPDGVSDLPESFTGKPGTEGEQIFYDDHGRPYKRPVTHKKPAPGVMTDEQGTPVHGVDVTNVPEGFTTKPGTDEHQIYYDEHGRPHKRPVTHKKPASGETTDEQGKPVDGVEGVTDFPEGFTGKPGTEGEQIFYDEYGRPHKRPVTHKKPVSTVMTDEQGKPVDGIVTDGEGVTDFPEGFTGKPGTGDHQIFFDEHGRPHRRPVTHAKPELDGEVLPDEHGKPIDGVTKAPEDDATTEITIGYGHTGKPAIKPGQFIPGPGGVQLLTDGAGSSTEDYAGITGISENETRRPSADKETTNYGEPGVTERPHKHSDTHGKPDGEVEEIITHEGEIESYPDVPDNNIRPVHEANKETAKKPWIHTIPGENVMTDENEQPPEAITELPEEQTELPGPTGSQEVFFDQYGRPHRRPVIHQKPEENATTEEHVKPGVSDVITEIPEGFTDKPESDSHLLFYDQFGRPHKRPISHKKPGEGMITDEHGKPVVGVEGVTDFPEGFTGKPGTDDQIYYDEYGRPHKRPGTHKKPVVEVEGVTDFPEGFTGKPGTEGEQIFYDEHGRPHKRPLPGVTTDEHGVPVDGTENVSEGFTGKPGTGDHQIFFDEHGRPYKTPVTQTKPLDGVEDVTEVPEGYTGKPGTEDLQIFYDEHGRPHKIPVSHKKPEETSLTDEEGEPADKLTEAPESGIQDVFLDPYGRPVKRPVTFTKPEVTGTDEDHGMTESFEGVTGKPESISEGVFYDNLGRPQKKPVMDDIDQHGLPQGVEQQGEKDGADSGQVDRPHSRPSLNKEPSTDFSESLPEEGESFTKHPNVGVYGGSGVEQNFFGETGRPQKKPVFSIGQKHPNMTDTAEEPIPTDSMAVTTESGEQINYDEHDRPHKKPDIDKQPSMTDENESPIIGVTGAPEGQTAKPESDEMEIFYDKYGKPHKRPISHVKPDLEGTAVLTDETDQQPVEKETTETPEEQTATLEKDKIGQTDKKPGQTKPDSDGTDEKEQSFEEKSPEQQKQKPGTAEHDQDGQPQKRPDPYSKPEAEEVAEKEPDHKKVPQIYGEHGHTGRPEKIPDVPKKPGTSTEKPMTEEHDTLVGVTTELPETETAESDTIYDKYGRPHKRPVSDKKPEVFATSEHVQPDQPEGITDMPEDLSGKPETDEQQIYYDPYGRPHKKPATHGKPEESMTTNKHDLPVEGVEEITETLQTEKPEVDNQEVLYDEYGRPYKRPVVQKKPGDGGVVGEVLEGDTLTESPEEFTGKPDGQIQQIHYDQDNQPHKKPEFEKKPDFTEQVATVEDEKGEGGTVTHEKDRPTEGDNEVTEVPYDFTGKPDSDEQEISYDELGKPHKRPVSHKKPAPGVMTDEQGTPVHGVDVTNVPEGFTTKPGTDEHQIYYDEHGRPHKRPVTHKKPAFGETTDEQGKPVDGDEGVTDFPEGFTGKPGTEGEQIFYDEYGRPHKRPVTHKKPVSTVMTDEQGKPVDGVVTDGEGVTDFPEGFTGKPGTGDHQIFFDEHGRPHRRPVTHAKPELDGEVLPDEHGKPIDGVTKAPEDDATTEITIGYGHTGKPAIKPGQFIPGPEGISTTDEVESMTKSPESFTAKPESSIAHPAQAGKPEDMAETYEHEKPLGGETDSSEDRTKEPGHEETSEFHVEHHDNDRPQEKPHSQTRPFAHRPDVPLQEHEQPEQEDTHPVYDIQKPSDRHPGVTEDDGSAIAEDLTETPNLGNVDQPMIFGEHGHTGRPHKRPVKPTIPETSESQDISGTSGVKPQAPLSSHEQDLPVGEDTIHKIPDTIEDHVTTDKKKPEFGSDEMATTEPEKATVHEEDELLHHKPDVEDSEPTLDTMETSDKGTTEISDKNAQKKPTEHPDEGTVPVEKRPETDSPYDSVTDKLGGDSTEIYYDNLGRPHNRPVHTRPAETDDMPEVGLTGLPTVPSQHGVDDDQHRPLITSVMGGAHTTEGAFYGKPDEIARPVSAEGVEHKPEFDGGELTHVSETERPHKKPLLKPGLDITGIMVDETGEPEVGVGITEKPEVHDEETGFKPSKRPTTQEVDEGIESTTKLSSGTVYDTKIPGFYDGQTSVDHEPQENEIPGVPEKDVTGVDDDSVTKLPEVAVDTVSELSEPQKKPTIMSHESEGSHTGSPDLPHLYPQQELVTSKTPEGDHSNVGEDTTIEDDDESLIITTDESGEDVTEMPQVLQEVHEKPESDAEEKPLDTKTKIPILPGQAQQGSTPALGPQFDDFTTSFYGAHDASGVPVTEKDGVAHVTTGKPEEHVSGVTTGFDAVKPHDVTTPKGTSEAFFPTTGHIVTDTDHAKPAGEDKNPALTGSTPLSEDESDESQVPEKDFSQGTPAGISDTAVGHGDTHPDLLPTQDTSLDAGALPELITPASTPEGTQGVPEPAGSPVQVEPVVPSGEMHSVMSSTTETPGKVSETKPALYQPPQIFIPYLPPDDGSSTKQPILIDEGLHESSPFDDILNNLANILRPSQTTEEPVGTTEDHGEVPGEGSCFLDGVTYQHNADIPPLSPCHKKCTCISSIIHCLSLKCPPPPEDVSHCTVVHEENSCCPTYVCGTDASPMFPVENQEGGTTTDTSTDKDESVAAHDYEPSKPTKPLSGVTSQQPEVTGSDDSSHIDQDLPVKHETTEKTSQESKPGVVSESKKPQFGSEVPEESDKGTPLTEKPEEDSIDEAHTSPEMDRVTSSKPESTGIEISTESKIPVKTSEDGVTPEISHIRPGQPQSGYHPISFGSKHPSTILPIYFGTEKPELPYHSHYKPESVNHVLDTDKPDQEGTEEPTSVAESIKPHGDKQKPTETDVSKPDDFVEPTTYRPVYHGTTKPVKPVGGVGQEDKTPDKVAAGEGESLKPGEADKEVEQSELHEHDETETGVHSALGELTPVKKPSEKPDEITSSKGKPQSGQEQVTGEELENQTTERPREKEPQIHVGTSEDDEIVHSTSKPHDKPETGVKPTYLDETLAHTTVEPHRESPETEESYFKPQSTDEPEKNFVQSSSQKPGLHHESTPSDISGESDSSIKLPATHDKPSEEGEEHKETSTLNPDRPIEVLGTQRPGQPISKINGTETIPTEEDVVSTDKSHTGAPKPTYDTVAGSEEPYKKPEESTDEPDDTLAYSTSQPVDQSESGKPLVSSGETTDMDKKPEAGHDGEEEPFVTSEGPHKEFTTEIYPSPVSEDSAHITGGPHEETPEEFEDLHEKHPSVHPTSMDNESAFTTEEALTEDKKPQGKPETEAYPTLTDEKSSTTKPVKEPSEVEQSQTKPESEEGLVVRPTEGSAVKKPTVSEKPVFGEKIPQGQQESDLVHSTTESQITDGKPEETKPQHAQDFSTTVRPKPGLHDFSGQDKPQTDDIPEEVFLHPTRMPGTYETARPDYAPEIEEDATPSQRPHTEDESVATIFPEGIIRPITKRPIYGTGKPVVSEDKQSTTPGHPFSQLGPQTGQGTGKPEEMFDVTPKPIFDIMTDVPEDFAQLFGIKPSTALGQQPDKYDKPEHVTHFFVPDFTTRVPDFKPQTTDHVKRPIHTTNGTHFIQYIPYKEGEVPLVPDGATLGELLERPDGEKYWPVIYMKLVTTTPGAEISQRPFKPIPQQVFNGTHFIQYVPYDDNKEPEVPEGTTLGQPQKGPDGHIYWPIIGNKPIMSQEDKPITEQPYPGQVYNGTHFIQYVPFNEGQKPEVPEDATLGEPENAPNGQKFWPIISNRPIPEDDSVTTPRPLQSKPEQIFNGTHFIQFSPYNDGQEPEIPEEATLGQPQKGPDGQIYWPIIDTKPLPLSPDKLEPTTEQPFHSAQVFNGTNFIQYLPFKDGVIPEVPEGATLGQPQKGPGGQMYWPIIYMRPRPVTPQGSFPEQVYNGTNFIQYVPYKDGHKPEVPSHATLGQPQKAPDGQMYWPIIFTKPVTAKPEDDITTDRPSQAPVFNGTHFIQYIPYMEGFEPDIPEEATLGKPEKKPDGETYWPIIYQKLPTRPKPEAVQHYPGQFFNGTHFVQYLPYRPSHKPHVPEGVTVSQPQKGPDGQMYWMLVSTKPLPTVQEKPTGPQFFNGTHFIQYVPYEKEKEPEVPEGATLGKPETGTGGQKFWPIIYMKPLPGVPITYQKPLDQELGTPIDQYKGQVFNGTHYVQYVPYESGKRPDIPEGGVLGQPTKRPDGQIYWPIIFQRPVPGVPVAYEDHIQTFDPIKGPVFNGTHYVQYVPYKPGERPILPEGATLGQPTKRPNGQLYWPIYYLRPVQETPVQGPMLWSPYDYIKPQPEQVYNGTHFIQYLPYNPTRMPEVPEGATLGQPQKGPGGQMYWVIISDKPLPAQTFNDTHVVQYVTPVTPEQEKPQTDQNKPIQVFNGSHYIQYVPYTPGQKPILPEGASLGQPTKGPEGQMYWPIIYMKLQPGKPNQQVPIFWGPGHDHLQPVSGQIFNGTHYIRFIKYDPSMKPIAPEGATISEPQRRPDGQLYWVIASKKPLSDMQVPLQQIFNGTHYIQYVPYNSSQMPQVPEGAILGHPQKGPEDQMYWVIISDKPLPAQPGTEYVQYVTPVTPEDDQMVPGPMFNGTHYIQYVPYKPAQIPKVPQDAILGELHKGPGDQMYWPIIYRRPPQNFNGTHYFQHVPDNVTGVDVSKPTAGTHHLQPMNATSKPAEDHPFWSYGQYAPRPGTGTLPTVNKFPGQKPGTEEHAFWTYGHDKPQNGSEDNSAYKPTTEYPSWSSGQIHNATKVPEISKLPSSGQYGGADHSKPGYEYESGYYKPEKPERPSIPEDSYEAIDEDHLIEYPSGSDYDETQEQPYGPGTCRYAGKVYVSAQQIPRDDPCDFCFCFRSDIICLQQSCPPPIPGCHEEPIQGFCCPRYECHVRMATLLNVTSTTTTTTTTLPPHFLSHVYKGAAGRTGCFIQGKAYRVGQAIPSASGPCMDCMCGGDGKMKCEPKVCTPEPMVRQMMVSSEKPTTANHR